MLWYVLCISVRHMLFIIVPSFILCFFASQLLMTCKQPDKLLMVVFIFLLALTVLNITETFLFLYFYSHRVSRLLGHSCSQVDLKPTR